MPKKKILLLSDDMRAPTGVGNMSREIVVNTVKEFDWVQLGSNPNPNEHGTCFDLSADVAERSGVSDASVRLYSFCNTGASGNGYHDRDSPYGNMRSLRDIIELEKPDVLLHFTDPRFWVWLYKNEHEVRKQLPIAYYTIWDATPAPMFNRSYYKSCDLLMCISMQTYNNVKTVLKEDNYKPWQITYVPHGINDKIFFPVDKTDQTFIDFKNQILEGKEYDFILLQNGVNMLRKKVADIILSYKEFCDKLPKEKADKTLLLLHTLPATPEGTDLQRIIDDLCPNYNIKFTNRKNSISPVELNYLYNLSDVTINLSSNEGFGLSTAESVMAGTPIIVNVTGGLQDQCGFKNETGKFITKEHFGTYYTTNADKVYMNHGEWVKPVFPATRTIHGSLLTPYLFDDIAYYKDAAEAILYWYNVPKEERDARALIGRNHFLNPSVGLSAESMGNNMIESINGLLENWEGRELVTLTKI